MRGIQLTPSEIAERGFLEGLKKRGIIMSGQDESSVFIGEGSNTAGILLYIPEVGIIQPQ